MGSVTDAPHLPSPSLPVSWCWSSSPFAVGAHGLPSPTWGHARKAWTHLPLGSLSTQCRPLRRKLKTPVTEGKLERPQCPPREHLVVKRPGSGSCWDPRGPGSTPRCPWGKPQATRFSPHHQKSTQLWPDRRRHKWRFLAECSRQRQQLGGTDRQQDKTAGSQQEATRLGGVGSREGPAKRTKLQLCFRTWLNHPRTRTSHLSRKKSGERQGHTSSASPLTLTSVLIPLQKPVPLVMCSLKDGC